MQTTNKKVGPRKLYSRLQTKDAKFIVARANNGFFMYKIAKIKGLNKDKIRRCLNKCKIETRKPNHSQPWKGPHIKIRYSFKQLLLDRDLSKSKRAYEYAQNAQTVYKTFVNFFRDVFENQKILGKKN